MKKLIKKILREDQRERYLDKIVHVMKNDYPLFHNLNLYGFYDQLSEEELNYVLSGIFGQKEPVKIKGTVVNDKNGNLIYSEDSYGNWGELEYNENGKLIYYVDSKDYWWKIEYDENGNEIYRENSNGWWEKSEYDKNGNEIYHETSLGEIVDNR